MVSSESIQAIANLITALFWPLIAISIFFYFGPPIKRFLQQSKEATVGGMGFEATFRRDFESALLYGLSVAKESDHPDQISEEQIEGLLSEFSTYLEPETQSEISEASVLWVDDNPDNNLYERETFESLGLNIDLSESTTDATKKLQTTNYDVVISDMGRPENDRAGYDLLEQKRQMGNTVPFIIYSYGVEEEHKQAARQRGAFGCTSSPRELYSLVRRALGGSVDIPTSSGAV